MTICTMNFHEETAKKIRDIVRALEEVSHDKAYTFVRVIIEELIKHPPVPSLDHIDRQVFYDQTENLYENK